VSGSNCNSITPETGEVVPALISQLATDGNGTIVTLSSLASQSPLFADAAVAAYGILTIGIGTESNNQPPAGLAVLDTSQGGILQTVFDGITFPISYLDTGTTYLSFSTYADTGLPNCVVNTGYYCPAQTTTLSAVINGKTSGTTSVTFPLGSADTYLDTVTGPEPWALDAIGSPGGKRRLRGADHFSMADRCISRMTAPARSSALAPTLPFSRNGSTRW
jgi:hypothetical protein